MAYKDIHCHKPFLAFFAIKYCSGPRHVDDITKPDHTTYERGVVGARSEQKILRTWLEIPLLSSQIVLRVAESSTTQDDNNESLVASQPGDSTTEQKYSAGAHALPQQLR